MTIPYHSMEAQSLAYPGSQQYQPPAPAPPPASFTSNTLPSPSPRTVYNSLSEATSGFFYNHKPETGTSSQIRKSLTNSDHQQQQPSHHPPSHQSFQSFHNFSQSPAAGQYRDQIGRERFNWGREINGERGREGGRRSG